MDKRNLDNLKTILKGGEVEKKIQSGYTGANMVGPNAKGKKPGDIWEHNGKTWMMKENGTVTNITRFDDVRVPMFCPRCESIMKGKASTKAFYINGTCLDCMIDDHDKLRREGKLEQFAWKKRLRSSKSWLKEQYQQLDEFKMKKEKNPEFVLSDGTIEKWDVNMDVDKIIEEYQDYLDNYDKELQNAIADYESKYNESIEQ